VTKTGSILLLLTVVPAIAQTPVMTNPAIQSMVHTGAPLETIIKAIKTAPRIDLYINNREYAQLLAAGATSPDADRIMKAIHDREYNGAEKNPGAPVSEESVRQDAAAPVVASVPLCLPPRPCNRTHESAPPDRNSRPPWMISPSGSTTPDGN
jgi:hypothetical protein